MRSLSEETDAQIYQDHYQKGYEELQQNLDHMFMRTYEPTQQNLNTFATNQYREVTEEHEHAVNNLYRTSSAHPGWVDGAHQAIIDYHTAKTQELGREISPIEQDLAVSV